MQLLFLQEWSKALGWTLLHSLWQGVLAAAIAGIVIIATRRSAARLRYNLLGSVLILFVLTSLVTFILYARSSATALVTTHNEVAPLPSIEYTTVDLPVTSTPTIASEFTNYFNNNAAPFVITWAIFFIFHGIKLLTGLASIQRMRVYKRHEISESWKLKLKELSDRLGIRQSVRLFQSELVKVPVAIGYLKPVILVPLGLLSHLPPDQAETILLHELAHIRRHDYVINLLQRIAEAVFFFNPALLWISSLIRQEREACCDDIVVANTQSKGSYLEALVSFQEYSLAGTGYAMAIGHNRHYLLNRVKRLMTRENKKLNLMEKIILIVSLVTITAFTLLPAKEAMAKKEKINTVTGVNMQTVQSPEKSAISAIQPRTSVKRKPVVVKDVKAINNDTLPKKISVSELVFKNVSSNTNDDGTTRTKTVNATDQNGKKYTLSKTNDKVTLLSIDGNTVPEADLKNYAELIDGLDHSRGNLGKIKEERSDKKTAESRAEIEERVADRRKEADENRAERMKERSKKLDEIKEDRAKEIDRKGKNAAEKRNEEMKDRQMEYKTKFDDENKDMKKRRDEYMKLEKEHNKKRQEQNEKYKKELQKNEREYMERKKELEEKYEELEEKQKDIEKEKKEQKKSKKDKKDNKDVSYSEIKAFDYVSTKKIELSKSLQINQGFKLESSKKFELNNKKATPTPAFKRVGLFSTPPSRLFKSMNPMKSEPKVPSAAPSMPKKANIVVAKMETPTVS